MNEAEAAEALAAIAESTANELRLLPWLATQLSFDIPLPSHDGMWNGHEELWPSVEAVVLPTLEPDPAGRVGRAFEDFLATPFDFPMTLVHNDLGLEHILMSATTGRFSGIIDFECATIGDPAVDFVPLRAEHGDAVFEQVTAGRELGDRVDERMHFYRWMGGVHAIIHGVTEDDEAILAEGLSELPERIDAPIPGA